MNSAQLLKFYRTWYHPNNAVYVIAGDVDPAGDDREGQARSSAIFPPQSCRRARRCVWSRSTAAIYHDTSDQPFTAVALGYRFPGYDSPDYAAGQILGDVLTSQRSTFGGLPYTGKALATQFVIQEYPKTVGDRRCVGDRAGDDAAGDDRPRDARDSRRLQEHRRAARSRRGGEAARDLAARVQRATRSKGLAYEWSQAVAVQGL